MAVSNPVVLATPQASLAKRLTRRTPGQVCILLLSSLLASCATYGLYHAVAEGDLALVETKLESIKNPDRTDAQGRTMLSIAAENGHTDIVQLLLERGASVDKQDLSQAELMAEGVSLQQLSSRVQTVMRGEGMQLVASDTQSMSPLYVAILSGQKAVVEQLVQSGANLESRNTGARNTPLFAAAMTGNREITDFLLARSANPLARNGHNQTALGTLAAASDLPESADLIGTAESLLQQVKSGASASLFTDYVNNLSPQGPAHSALHGAALTENLPLIDLLLKNGAQVNLTASDGVTPLSVAAQRGYGAAARRLLTAKADPNIASDEGITALTLAAEEGHTDMVSLLLANGARVNGPAGAVRTPLSTAVDNNDKEVVRRLLAARADPDIVVGEKQHSPLFVAVELDSLELVEMLLAARANPNLADKDGETALHGAVTREQVTMASRLLEGGADPNRLFAGSEKSPLLEAVIRRNTDLVKALLRGGASPELGRSGEEQWQSGTVAVSNGDFAILEALLSVGMDPNQTLADGKSGLFLAVEKQDKDSIRALLAAGANPDLATTRGFTPLYIAVFREQLETATALLEANADPELVNYQGYGPLYVAVHNNSPRLVSALLQAGANPNIVSKEGLTPLYKAISDKNLPLAQQLLAAKASANVITHTGESPLHKAAEDNYMEGFRLLVANGADRTLRNNRQQTADDIIRARQEALARQQAAEQAERQRKEESRAAFMGALMTGMQTITQDLEASNARSQAQLDETLARARAQGEAQAREREAAEAARQRAQVDQLLVTQQLQAQAFQADQARLAEQRRQQAQAAAAQAEANRQQVLAQERRQREEAEQRRKEQQRLEAQAYLVTMRNGLRMRGLNCFGESHVAPAQPFPTGAGKHCIDVSFTARCPGQPAWQTSDTLYNMASISAGCFGESKRIATPSCNPADLSVTVTDVNYCR